MSCHAKKTFLSKSWTEFSRQSWHIFKGTLFLGGNRYSVRVQKSIWILTVSILVFAGVGLGGCSSSSPQSNQDQKRSYQEEQMARYAEALKPINVSWSSPSDSFNKFRFDCEDCPAAIGHVISKISAEQSGNCQGGFFNDTFISNRHCIPEELHYAGASCAGLVKVLLPQLRMDQDVEIVDCDKVIAISSPQLSLNIEDVQPDWVILKLKKSPSSRAQPASTSGIADGETLVGFVPVETGVQSSQLMRIECQAIQNSLHLPEFHSDQGPLAYFQCDQDATRGFSGTTLFRQSEKGYEPVATISHLLDSKEQIDATLVSQFVVASQYGCMVKNAGSPSCAFNPQQHDRLKEDVVVNKLKKMKTDIDEELASWLNQRNNPIRWERIEENEWRSLPASYGEFFRRESEVQYPNLSRSHRGYFSQVLVPIFAACIRQEFLPETDESVDIPTEVPVVRASLTMEQKRLRGNWSVEVIPVHIRRTAANQYILKKGRQMEDFHKSEGLVMGGYFSHSSVQIPRCK